MDIMDITSGWLVDWGKDGGAFKEWIRGMHLESLSSGWIATISRQPYYWYRNLVRVAGWIPFLWKDRDWDYVYLWIIMHEKLKRLHKEVRHGHSACRIKTSKEIKIAIDMLQRMINDRYVDKDLEKHYKKFDSVSSRTKKMPNGTMVTSPHKDPECGRSIRRIYKKEMRLQNKDYIDLGRHFAKHWRGWWD